MHKNTYNIAIVGATGVVGEVFLELLLQRQFPYGDVFAVASSQSAGSTVNFGASQLEVVDVAEFDFSVCDYVFFSAGREVSKKYAPQAVAAGCTVIDNSSEFRYEEDVPLVIPEVNAELLAANLPRGIVANPNCSTIQMLAALYPIHEAVGIESIHVSTYQAVSGAGSAAIEELARQSISLLNGEPADVEVLPEQIAFNVVPYIDELLDNGYTREEMKMLLETQKIFKDNTIAVNATAVRVPVFYGHAESIFIQTKTHLPIAQVEELLTQAPGVTFIKDAYVTPVTHAAAQDAVCVSRLRQDLQNPNGLSLWVVADNVRKGAALNALQIAELLINKRETHH